jgi:transposase-like protein
VPEVGRSFADKLRRRRPRPGDTWHLDEVFLRINGEQHYLWRAVDKHGVVLDILVQNRRNAAAAKRFFKRLLRELQYKPRRLITDGLRSYRVAKRAVLPEVRHRISRYPAISTTGLKIRTGRPGDVSGRCTGSNHSSRHTAVPIGARYS